MYVDVVFMPYTKRVLKKINTTMNTTSILYCIILSLIVSISLLLFYLGQKTMFRIEWTK